MSWDLWKRSAAMSDMIGAVFTKIEKTDDQISFFNESGEHFRMYHSQDCCESVYVEDICGDLDDLVGTPILEAEEVSSEGEPPMYDYEESYTWTFYKLSTIKGSVTIRWYGSSNGYYSESVDIADLQKEVEA